MQFRPILVGTTSVEDSELVSKMLTRQNIPHSLLNARPKYAAIEAQVGGRNKNKHKKQKKTVN